jgi:SAM-dependent methyltransferase
MMTPTASSSSQPPDTTVTTAPFDTRTVLNLGCGRRARSDAVNVDLVPGNATDVVHALDRLPRPFPDNRFAEILAFDVIEHLDRLVPVMEELHRVAAPGAIVRITVPNFSSSNAFTDITHRHYFGWFSTHHFTGENQWDFYTTRRFERVTSTLMFQPSLVNKVVRRRRLANRYPLQDEQRWTWMFPAWFLHFELRVLKP